MKEIIESFFRERSLVNHQLASYDDCIPSGDNSLSRMVVSEPTRKSSMKMAV